jgi:hypothetical protein
MMPPDVVWANGREGGHVLGREGVRSYWSRQWSVIDRHGEPSRSSHGINGEAPRRRVHADWVPADRPAG